MHLENHVGGKKDAFSFDFFNILKNKFIVHSRKKQQLSEQT